MSHLKPKISIIGVGNVGSTYAYTLIISRLAREVVLIDKNQKLARGIAMDMNHGLSFLSPISIRCGEFQDCEDSDIVVITAGANRKPGQSRTDLAQNNVDIFKSIIPQITRFAPYAVYIVVTNPVDILTYVSLKISGLPAGQIIGSGTVLDTARLKYTISDYYKVDSGNVHAYIIGEHGETELPVWSNAQIGGMPIEKYGREYAGLNNIQHDLEKIFHSVKNAGKQIIEAKGATNYSIALSIQKISRSILRNENSILPVSTLVSNFYGVSDVCISIPSHVTRKGVDKFLKIELNKKEKQQFTHSANVLKDILRKIGF
ncbi:MAG: L-lactate dehydrogenase [Bacteroidota bacterium]